MENTSDAALITAAVTRAKTLCVRALAGDAEAAADATLLLDLMDLVQRLLVPSTARRGDVATSVRDRGGP